MGRGLTRLTQVHDTPVVEVGEATAAAAPVADQETAPGSPAHQSEPSQDAPSLDADTGDEAVDSAPSEVEDVEESVEVDESTDVENSPDEPLTDESDPDESDAEAVDGEAAVDDDETLDEGAAADDETTADEETTEDDERDDTGPGPGSDTGEPSAAGDPAPVFTAPSCAVIDEFTEQLIHTKSATSGPVVDDAGSTVRFRRMSGIPGTLWSWLLALVTLSLSVAYAVWLLRSGPPLGDRILRAAGLAAAAVVVATLTVEVLRLLLIGMLSMATSLVRKPVPVKPHKNLKVAVLVTFVPISESLTMLDETLRAAQRLEVPHGTRAGGDDDPALIDIFVLDEGDPDHPHAVQETVDRLNAASSGHRIHRVSRYGIGKYHRGKKFATRTKHGNVNAAYEMIRENPEYPRYDVLIGLDPDHVPMPELTSRLCGYFNDPNVAYVAAPQAYANSTVHVVAKLAESQQFVFHSLIQPAANSYGGPMLVGTNYALRTSVFEQIDGAQPSITEDLATGLKALSNRNPDTGRRWTAVYTPDVLAHGEGPNTWGAYFKQQNRWATGAIRHVIAGPFIFQMMKTWHSPRRVLHYSLLMAFYPVMAVTWILGAVNAGLFALSGGSGTVVDPGHWVLFYTWTIIAQVTIFIAARRHNVSPYESANSWGVYGMFMSVAAAPIYVSALLKSLVTSNPTFDVTPKGGTAANRDSLFTFRLSLFWAVLYVVIAWRIITTGYGSVATLTWPAIALFLSLAPVVIWLAGTPRRRRRRADDPGPATTPAEDTALVAIAAKDG